MIQENGYDQENKTGKIANDYRITTWGRWARKLWLDEVEDKNLYIESCSDIYKDCGVYDIFNPLKSIQEHVISDRDVFVGLHIRRSDNEMSIKYSPTELFLEAIEKEIENNPAVKFYLATDDSQEEKLITERFGDRICTYKKRSVDRNTEVAIVDAMIDLTNLASCYKIYGSYYSSFSDVAAIWGNIEKEVLNIINKYKTHNNIYITSFKYKILENVRNLDKNINRNFEVFNSVKESENSIPYKNVVPYFL